MTVYAVTLRSTGGDVLAQDDIESESIQQAVVTLYRRAYPTLRPQRGIGLWNRFPGGTTAHVQMGFPERGGRGTHLDSKLVVQWDVLTDR